MEIKLNVELKVPEGIMSNLAEVDKTKLEEYLQECLVEYLSTPKQETIKLEFETPKQGTKEFNFDNISEMPDGIEAELLPREFMARAKSTKEFKFDDIGAMTEKELDVAQQILSDFALNGKQGTKEFKFDNIGAMTNK